MDTREITRIESQSERSVVDLDRIRDATAKRMLRDLPPTIGRYRVVSKIGEGGMGTVYRAHDPQLDRPVAIKLLKPHGRGPSGVAEQARMLREARALAAVSHPNVVDVYEVGTHEGALFLAMEYVDATDLREWLDYDVPGWAQVVRAFVAAGRGLAAAHAIGLVHRDFKPSNVLLGHDGRCRVVDFGLAKGLLELSVTPTDPSSDSDAGASYSLVEALALDLTQTGAVIGTPAYMAPEQLRGKRADASADQFAFCISVWEGLFGQRPFAGKTPKEVLRAIERRPPRVPPGRHPVPRSVVDALRRGLAVKPTARWPRLDDLLDELARHATPTRRLRAAITLGTIAAATALAIAWPSESPNRCAEPLPAVTQWADVDREALQSTFTAADRSDEWDRLDRALEAHADQIGTAWAQTCSPTRDDGLAADRERACLRRRSAALETVIELLTTSAPPTLPRMLASLPSATTCSHHDDHTPTPPPSQAEAVLEAERDLTRAQVLRLADRPEAAYDLYRLVLARADAIGWPPLVARALVARAANLVGLGRHEEARVDLERAFTVARAAGDDLAAMSAAHRLAHVVGVEMHHPDEALTWARHSEAAAVRAGKEDPTAHLESTLGLIYINAGRSDDAVRHLERAAELLTNADELAPREQIDRRRELGGVLLHLGRPGEAATHFEAALQLVVMHYGPGSHDAAALSFNLGMASFEVDGDANRAYEHYARSAEVYRELLPPMHPDLGDAMFHAGSMLAMVGRYDDAEPDLRRGLQILDRALGSDDPFVVQARIEYAEVRIAAGRHADADAILGPTMASATARLGAQHPLVGRGYRVLGDLAVHRGDIEAARVAYTASLEGVSGADPVQRSEWVGTVTAMANAELTLGSPEEAESLADRARADAVERFGSEHHRTAETTLRLLAVYRAVGRADEVVDEAERALTVVRVTAPAPEAVFEACLEVGRTLEAAGRPGRTDCE